MGPQRGTGERARLRSRRTASRVAVVREDGHGSCTPMRAKSLNSLNAAETELREMRSAWCGIRSARRGRRVLRHCAPGAFWHPAPPVGCDGCAGLRDRRRGAREARSGHRLRRPRPQRSPSRRATCTCCPMSACPRRCSGSSSPRRSVRRRAARPIAREMGFADELSAVIDRLDR